MTFEEHSAFVLAEIDRSGLPEHMHDSIREYVLRGQYMGDFLTCIFANDFVHAAGRADIENRACLFQYARLLHMVPAGCWGDQESIVTWRKLGGLAGVYANAAAKAPA